MISATLVFYRDAKYETELRHHCRSYAHELGTLVYFHDHERRIEMAKEDRLPTEQRQTEIVALTEKLAASERALAELKKPAFGNLKPFAGRIRRSNVRREQLTETDHSATVCAVH